MKHERQTTKEHMAQLGAKWKRVRLSLDLNVDEMAEHFGIHPSTLRRWERGVSVPQQDIYDIEQTYQYIMTKHRERDSL